MDPKEFRDVGHRVVIPGAHRRKAGLSQVMGPNDRKKNVVVRLHGSGKHSSSRDGFVD
jgi:hypothetical protein